MSFLIRTHARLKEAREGSALALKYAGETQLEKSLALGDSGARRKRAMLKKRFVEKDLRSHILASSALMRTHAELKLSATTVQQNRLMAQTRTGQKVKRGLSTKKKTAAYAKSRKTSKVTSRVQMVDGEKAGSKTLAYSKTGGSSRVKVRTPNHVLDLVCLSIDLHTHSSQAHSADIVLLHPSTHTSRCYRRDNARMRV
jgi:hypothetical protein